MTMMGLANQISQLLQQKQNVIGDEWLAQLNVLTLRSSAASKEQLRKHTQQFLVLFTAATRGGELENVEHRS